MGSSPGFPPQIGTFPVKGVGPDRLPVSPRLGGCAQQRPRLRNSPCADLRLLRRFGARQPLDEASRRPDSSCPHEAPNRCVTRIRAEPHADADQRMAPPGGISGDVGLIMPPAGPGSRPQMGRAVCNERTGWTRGLLASRSPPSRGSACGGGGLGSGGQSAGRIVLSALQNGLRASRYLACDAVHFACPRAL